jgi:hypothetical protein
MEQRMKIQQLSFSLVLVDSLHLWLKGDIRRHADDTYTVTDIRRLDQETGSLLPPIHVRKKAGQWVHTDSDKETDLSVAIGQAIDEQQAREQ